MRIRTWDNLTDEHNVFEIEDTVNPEEIVRLTDLAMGNPEGALEWDEIKRDVVDGKMTITAKSYDDMHPMIATYTLV